MSFHSYFITTAIPYVNSKPHIGHAQEFILADSLARYYRGQGKKAVLQSGTDDNATKNVLAAKEAGLPVREFVDLNANKFRSLLSSLHIEPDYFVRTSSPQHFLATQEFVRRLQTEDLYTSSYGGLYCSGCEDFYSEQDLVGGLCPDHQKAPERIEEKNIFFHLSKYQNRLAELIESDAIKITPATKKNEVLSFIRLGLRDISLTRSAVRTQGWGIPFPGSSDQTIYVWIDALVNYISGHPACWSEDTYKLHVIGKNVWKFHAIYWPALLLSAGLPLPNEIVIHGFLTNEGVKISKSLGNGIDPFEVIERYGADALRFYLVGVLPFDQDADFVEKNLIAVYNSELANKLGNLVSRVLTLGRNLELVPSDLEINQVVYQNLREEAFRRIADLNHEINAVKPWDLLKQNKTSELETYFAKWVYQLRLVAQLVEPFIPEGTARLRRAISERKTGVEPLFPRF